MKPPLFLLPCLALLIACPVSRGDDDDSGGGDDDDATEDLGPPPAALAEVSAGSCPDLSSAGSFAITSNGVARTGQIFLPSSLAPGAPVLFAWHGLGDNPSNFSSAFGFSAFADTHDMIVVVPAVNPGSFTSMWDHLGGDSDLVLYDDLRTCLSEQHDIDLRGVHSTGFSAGALWTSLLAMERSDTLASVFTMSGGVGEDGTAPYSTPAHEFPALLMWGGTADTYNAGVFILNFEAATLNFSESLRNDGHFVVHCNHGGGHTVTMDTGAILGRWVDAHRFGQISPFEGTDGAGVADWCEVP